MCCFDPKKKMIHLYGGREYDGHIQFSLEQIIPTELDKFYQAKYHKLIAGYIKRLDLACLPPNEVIGVIVVFFSQF